MTSAVTFTLGSHYRRSVYRNPYVMGTWIAGFTFLTLLLLLPECSLTRVFHIASENFNHPNATNPVWHDWQKMPSDANMTRKFNSFEPAKRAQWDGGGSLEIGRVSTAGMS